MEKIIRNFVSADNAPRVEAEVNKALKARRLARVKRKNLDSNIKHSVEKVQGSKRLAYLERRKLSREKAAASKAVVPAVTIPTDSLASA